MSAALAACSDCATARARCRETGDTYVCTCGRSYRARMLVYRADPDAPREPVTAVRERAQLAREEVAELALCGHCEITRAFRRGLCRSCYRKLREAGCPLPPVSLPGPEGTPALERWVRSLPDDVRREIAALLMEAP